jgi:hypothetical protein
VSLAKASPEHPAEPSPESPAEASPELAAEPSHESPAKASPELAAEPSHESSTEDEQSVKIIGLSRNTYPEFIEFLIEFQSGKNKIMSYYEVMDKWPEMVKAFYERELKLMFIVK